VTAAEAAFSHESVLVPTSSMTLYTLSVMPSPLIDCRPRCYAFPNSQA
jgi:hypothetical protein